jgi:hypothetical protein
LSAANIEEMSHEDADMEEKDDDILKDLDDDESDDE